MEQIRHISAEQAAMTRFFRIFALNDAVFSEDQLDERDCLVERYPEAWKLARQLGPLPALIH